MSHRFTIRRKPRLYKNNFVQFYLRGEEFSLVVLCDGYVPSVDGKPMLQGLYEIDGVDAAQLVPVLGEDGTPTVRRDGKPILQYNINPDETVIRRIKVEGACGMVPLADVLEDLDDRRKPETASDVDAEDLEAK